MLKEGDIVEIDQHFYKVVTTEILPCRMCNLKNCQKSEGYDALKAKHFALSCVDLMPLHACFIEVNCQNNSHE